MLLIEYAKCTTCQKAAKWLAVNGFSFDRRPIKEQNPTAQELRLWRQKSGLPLKRFFNTSGLLYKALGLKDRLLSMGEEEQYALLASNGMLVRRPILVEGDLVLVGFREREWAEALKK
ncbi:MAG: arsenate reductase family protein [Oscillospiraceae bacterium]|nr:arsenate reductase family protein [Oscillospiraceae bacterium]